ncbi:hypothetical protein V8E36_000070 [Tilletia maclaganii]
MSASNAVTTSAGGPPASEVAIVRPGQSVEDFQRAFWSHQIKVVESDDMDSLLMRVGMAAGADGGGGASSHSRNASTGKDTPSPEDGGIITSAQLPSGEGSTSGSANGHTQPASNARLEPFPIPLARIKKVIKSNDEVSMVSSEAPVLLARACEILIADLSSRAFLIADSHRRRTIQRSDIRDAIAQTDVFDFAIDILPRDPSGGAADQSTASV